MCVLFDIRYKRFATCVFVCYKDKVYELGQTQHGLYKCDNEKTKRMRMMNLGRNTKGGMHKLNIAIEFQQFAQQVRYAHVT